jgi:signal peptidase I
VTTPPTEPAAQPAAKPAPNAATATPAPKSERIDWWGEIKGVLWLLLAVLGFHSFIAKPFYIPSESMMPGLLTGDRLVVSKFPYGWSFVSPTIPSPSALFRRFVLGDSSVESIAVQIPFMSGRVIGSLPERGDVVIATPPGVNQDYIKRVIGLPGDRIEVRDGIVILNGVPIKRGPKRLLRLPVDENAPCHDGDYPAARAPVDKGGTGEVCLLPIYRETLPNGRSYNTIDMGSESMGDDFGPITVPDAHVFLMGDNRDHSADSRFSINDRGLGGAVPWENIGGRAEFITFSLDGSTQWWNPVSWFTALRSGRAGSSLHAGKDGE